MQAPGYYLSDEYTDEMVYRLVGRLIRWRSPIVLSLGAGLAGDAAAEEVLARLIAALPSIPALPNVSAGSSGNVVLELGTPVEGALAHCQWRLQGSDVVGATLVFGSREIALGGPPRGNTPLHELGHALGLTGHSDRAADVMAVGGRRDGSWNFSGDETALLTMMYVHRRPGNRAPDRDPEIAGAYALHTLTVACGR